MSTQYKRINEYTVFSTQRFRAFVNVNKALQVTKQATQEKQSQEGLQIVVQREQKIYQLPNKKKC